MPWAGAPTSWQSRQNTPSIMCPPLLLLVVLLLPRGLALPAWTAEAAAGPGRRLAQRLSWTDLHQPQGLPTTAASMGTSANASGTGLPHTSGLASERLVSGLSDAQILRVVVKEGGWSVPGWGKGDPCATWQGVFCDTQSHVTRLDAFDLNLRSGVPSSLGRLVNLKSLDLHFNSLKGSIPASLGRLKKLEHLALYGNNLSGRIPASIGRLSKLQYLLVSNNKLSGTIPASLGNLRELVSLGMYGNKLTGTIPSSFSRLKQLNFLDLGYSMLTGSIPASLGKLRNLVDVDFSWNRLGGPIPGSLANSKSIENLRFQNNSLSGSIPASFGALRNLLRLDLAYNQLSGRVPPFVFKLWRSGLFSFNLSKNYLVLKSCPSGVQDLVLQNCIKKTPATVDCSSDQRSPATCRAFCDALAKEGPCGGHGRCYLKGPKSIPTCACRPPYVVDPAAPGICVFRA